MTAPIRSALRRLLALLSKCTSRHLGAHPIVPVHLQASQCTPYSPSALECISLLCTSKASQCTGIIESALKIPVSALHVATSNDTGLCKLLQAHLIKLKLVIRLLTDPRAPPPPFLPALLVLSMKGCCQPVSPTIRQGCIAFSAVPWPCILGTNFWKQAFPCTPYSSNHYG